MAEKGVEKLVRGLREAFPEGPPDDETVRSQGFAWAPDQWRKRWPNELPMPAVLKTAGAGPRVDRADVFARASTVKTEADAVELFVLMGAWGTGTQARSIARIVRPLHQPGAAERLLAAHRIIREGGDAEESYRRMYSTRYERIKYLGPAFFTKWLYFSAYDTWSFASAPPPLILDRKVALTMGWRTTGWPAGTYRDYLDTATSVRDQWAPGVALHVVEYALFKTV